MKYESKRIVALQIAIIMLLSIVTCVESNNGSTQESKITIWIEWWGTDNRNEYTQELLNLYSKLYPNIVFEANSSGLDGYFDRPSTQAATGTMPDIVQMDYMYLNTYSKNNSLADLSRYIEDGTIDTSNINVDVLNMGAVNGELTGIVCSTTTMAVVGRYVSFVPDPAWIEEVVLTCMSYMQYLPIPLVGIVMIIFEVEAIYTHFKAFFVKEEVEA